MSPTTSPATGPATSPATSPGHPWRDRRVLLTGATGFLGSWMLRRLLDEGAEVTAVVRDWTPRSEAVRSGALERATVVRGDVRDQALLERALGERQVDTVFHLAAQTQVQVANRNPPSTFGSNIEGTWAVLEACRRSPLVQAVVVASSDKAYGEHERLPYTEDAALLARHPYDASKACADVLARSYAATFGAPVAVTRCANLYGGGDLHWGRLVPGTVRSALRGEAPVVRSDGRLVRDYLHVDDAVEAYLLLAERLREAPKLCGEAFNVSAGQPLPVLDMVRRILHAAGSTLAPRVLDEATGEIPRQYLDATKARQVLGWRPRVGLDEGLARTVAWYRAHLDLARGA